MPIPLINRREFLLSLAVTSVAGCAKSVSEQATQTDANGFLCRHCGEKFYTSLKVFPAYCAKCKSTDLAEVVGHICADGEVILAPRDQVARSKRTGQVATSIKMPREKDLLAWGAVKRSGQEVGAGP